MPICIKYTSCSNEIIAHELNKYFIDSIKSLI